MLKELKLFILKAEETEQEENVNENTRGWRIVKLPNKANYIVHYRGCVDAFFVNAAAAETPPKQGFSF